MTTTNPHGYQDFKLGSFTFRRDEYFAHISWTTKQGKPMSHTMDVGGYLRALMRDVAWGFFYGGVNFDHVIGTTNHYKTVDLYAGTYNATLKEAGVDVDDDVSRYGGNVPPMFWLRDPDGNSLIVVQPSA